MEDQNLRKKSIFSSGGRGVQNSPNIVETATQRCVGKTAGLSLIYREFSAPLSYTTKR